MKKTPSWLVLQCAGRRKGRGPDRTLSFARVGRASASPFLSEDSTALVTVRQGTDQPAVVAALDAILAAGASHYEGSGGAGGVSVTPCHFRGRPLAWR